MMDIFNIKGLVVSFTLGALLALPATYFVHRYDNDETQIKIDVQKQQAADELQTATNNTHAVEKRLAALGQQIEVTHNAAQKVLDDNDRLNRQLVAARGLFDPGRRPSGASPVPQAGASGPAGIPAGTADDGRLSADADQFLLALADRANRSRQYAQSCYKWAHQVTERWNAAQTGISLASTPAQ